MIAVRGLLSALLFGGVLAPLGPHALVHAWSDAHFHRHANGVAHSHHHEADHHEHEIDANPSREARLLPSSATTQSDSHVATLLPASSPVIAPPQIASQIPPSHLSGAPPGRRAFPHLGRAPPA